MAKKNSDYGLPKIVGECSGYRFVATEVRDVLVKNQTTHYVNVGVGEDPVFVILTAESRGVDNLGKDKWNVCSWEEAVRSAFDEQLRAAVLEKPESAVTKSKK